MKRFHYDDHNQLRRQLADLIDAYNFGRRLKTLRGLTPYEFIVRCWRSEPERFTLDPTQSNAATEHLMCLGPAIRDPSLLPARTSDGVGYSAEHLVA